jgi:uncharacterized membrane protein YqgA involved in biofilm formation
MFILKFIPLWFCGLLVLAGTIGYFASRLLPTILHRKLSKIIGCAVVFLGIYLLGMKYVDNWWQAQAQKLQEQIVLAEKQSATVNTVVEEKIVVKKQIIETRGKDIINYIDREVVKYDTTCVIPKEFIEAHNKGAASE